ncbi:MAG: DUF86 domain-containing protein [Synergistaceae bacterium]|jgi:uncharacterized protein with HEPN domain|nr:DUF86 domain-containing protein [Synergistaceae bacterium]
MREEARLVNKFIDGVEYDGFMQNEEKKRAVTQTPANIGELCRALSDGVKARYKNVPWAAIRKTRNVITHDYESVDFTDIWHSATIDVLNLAAEIDAIERDIGVELYGNAEREANYNEILEAIREADEQYT